LEKTLVVYTGDCKLEGFFMAGKIHQDLARSALDLPRSRNIVYGLQKRSLFYGEGNKASGKRRHGSPEVNTGGCTPE
jgi:hypothetical protein